MPRIRTDTKEVPDWEYPSELQEIMGEFETIVEQIRADIAKSNRNMVAGRRARTTLQTFRYKFGARLRKALFEQRDRLKALRNYPLDNDDLESPLR